MVTDYPQVDLSPYTEKGIAKVDPDKYPMAGGNTHVVTVGIYNLQTNKTVYLQTPVTDVSPTALQQTCYFTNIAWSPDSKTVYMFELNRDQNDCRLVSYDATTGARMKEIYRETLGQHQVPDAESARWL